MPHLYRQRLIALALLALAPCLVGATHYVRLDGSDSVGTCSGTANASTASSPNCAHLTIQDACTDAASGDTIHITAGTYTTTSSQTPCAGTPARNVFCKISGKDNITIQGEVDGGVAVTDPNHWLTVLDGGGTAHGGIQFCSGNNFIIQDIRQIGIVGVGSHANFSIDDLGTGTGGIYRRNYRHTDACALDTGDGAHVISAAAGLTVSDNWIRSDCALIYRHTPSGSTAPGNDMMFHDNEIERVDFPAHAPNTNYDVLFHRVGDATISNNYIHNEATNAALDPAEYVMIGLRDCERITMKENVTVNPRSSSSYYHYWLQETGSGTACADDANHEGVRCNEAHTYLNNTMVQDDATWHSPTMLLLRSCSGCVARNNLMTSTQTTGTVFGLYFIGQGGTWQGDGAGTYGSPTTRADFSYFHNVDRTTTMSAASNFECATSGGWSACINDADATHDQVGGPSNYGSYNDVGSSANLGVTGAGAKPSPFYSPASGAVDAGDDSNCSMPPGTDCDIGALGATAGGGSRITGATVISSLCTSNGCPPALLDGLLVSTSDGLPPICRVVLVGTDGLPASDPVDCRVHWRTQIDGYYVTLTDPPPATVAMLEIR